MLKIHGTFSSLQKPLLSDGSWFSINKAKELPFQISLPLLFPSYLIQI